MWRVEFHPCGWSSRWYVVKGYYDQAVYAMNPFFPEIRADFSSEDRAKEKCNQLNKI